MKLDEPAVRPAGALSAAARKRLLSRSREPLFIADWDRALMIHYEVEPELLQRIVPFEIDLLEDRAFVSLVAFTMKGMRPRFGGRLMARLLRPIATHGFLNVRTYVKHGCEKGIYFLAEWLSNRLSVALGPSMFGLPYRWGRLDYRHDWESGAISGRVADRRGSGNLAYRAVLSPDEVPRACDLGSLDEWLMERYTAFTHSAGRARFFRVWHPPWRQVPAAVTVRDQTLLEQNWPLFHDRRPIGANFSLGLRNVWMGWPHRVQ